MSRKTNRRKGNIVVLSAFMMVGMFAFVSFGVDLGYLSLKKARLQNAADAAAHACAWEMHQSLTNARLSAISSAEQNCPNAGKVLQENNVIFGNWDRDGGQFSPGGLEVDAVRVVCRRHSDQGNAVPLFLLAYLALMRRT